MNGGKCLKNNKSSYGFMFWSTYYYFADQGFFLRSMDQDYGTQWFLKRQKFKFGTSRKSITRKSKTFQIPFLLFSLSFRRQFKRWTSNNVHHSGPFLTSYVTLSFIFLLFLLTKANFVWIVSFVQRLLREAFKSEK